MRCVACDAELIPGKRFCVACGARAPITCASCGAALEPGFRFCPDCGHAVGDAEPPVPPPAPAAATSAVQGERKQVTVLFCDLVGSTAIAERLDPEEYHDLLERFLERVFPEIYRFGGIVNQLAGDGLMALFGAPVAHEDDAQRAIRAALAIRETLGPLAASLREERGIELQARIGIHTGPVVVGTVGNSFKMDYTAIGDTTNLAARLQTLARPGSILVSEATQRLVRGFFVVEPTGPLDVRGKSEPVSAYEVIARAATTTPMAIAAERGLTPFVGRDAELARLERAFDGLAAEGPGVVAVVGAAGIGKSRLVYEFRRRLGAERAVFFEGRCSSMNQEVPYHPIMSMLRRYFELAPGDDHAGAAAKLSAKVGVQFGHLARMYPLLSRFLALPGGTPEVESGEEFKQEVFDAVAQLVIVQSRRAPVVLVVEDVQWIDEPSRELLGALLKRMARAPVLALLSHRKDADVRWGDASMVETLELPRLATDDVRAIVRAVAGGPLPSELEPVVVAKAAGSPFFAEELVRTLVEEGHLQGNGSGLRLARPLAEIPMPGTIHEVIAARLDRLSPHTKRVVQVAAVLGRQFSRRDVAALLAEERIAVARELDTLVERGLLHRKTTLGEDELRFGESLVQEVAYEGLLLRQRRQLHERVARLLEALPGAGGPERSALLAHHWARSDDRRRAVEALLRAARDAEAVPSYAVAAEFYRRAWEATEAALAEAPDERLERAALEATAALSRLVVYFALPLVDDALRAVARTRELAERLREPEALAGSFYMQGVLTTMLDGRRYAEGLALAERGLAIAEEQGLRLATARIARGMCINYTVDGRFEQARRLIDPLLAAMEQVENAAAPSDLYLSTRWAKDVLLYACDDLDAALTHLTDTLALGERAGNRTIRCIASGLLAQIHYLRGDDERSKACADRCLEIAETIGNMSAYPAAASLAILTRSALGETVDAALHVERLEQGLAAAGVMQLNVRFVAEALLAAGDVGRAQAHVETLHAVVGGRLRQALVELAWADVMAALGRAAEAARGYRAAVALSEEIGARSPLAAALIGLADLDVQRGAAPDARLVARARGICDTVGLGRYRARLERLTAQPAPALAAPA